MSMNKIPLSWEFLQIKFSHYFSAGETVAFVRSGAGPAQQSWGDPVPRSGPAGVGELSPHLLWLAGRLHC